MSHSSKRALIKLIGLSAVSVAALTACGKTEEAAAPADSGFDATAYARTVFSMAPAEQRWVRLSFVRVLIGAVLDRFGSDVPMEQLDENTYAITAPVRVSPPFYGWVFQFCGRMRILAPEDVCERMLLMLEAMRASGRMYAPTSPRANPCWPNVAA